MLVRNYFLLLCAAFAALLVGCTAVGPDYVRPVLDVPSGFKEASAWKQAEPQAADSGQAWWRVFKDKVLSDLMADAVQANQNIKQAEAQYAQARALADATRASLWPTLGLNGGAGRALTNTTGIKESNTFSLGLAASWELDLWGAVRRNIEAGAAGAEASADDLAAARLSIQTTLAQNYMQLRSTDQQIDLYKATIGAYTASHKLTQAQYKAGVVLRSDVALAESQLATAQAQAVDLEAQRSQLEHAIAVLTGRAPANFSLAPMASADISQPLVLPAVPIGLPSQLLERRPDVAAAERRAAVANANIGVARAAYFPRLILGAGAGYANPNIANLLTVPGQVWSLGAQLAQTLFDGGLRSARSAQVQAAFDGAAAAYKQTVLTSFQQVEDNMALLGVLEREAAFQRKAVEASQLAERLATAQYKAGTTNYLSVVTAQTLSLSNQRAAVLLRARQLAASIRLITATGGGWIPTK